MNEIEFLIGIRRALLYSVSLIDKRIEFLRTIMKPAGADEIAEINADIKADRETQSRLNKVTGTLKFSS